MLALLPQSARGEKPASPTALLIPSELHLRPGENAAVDLVLTNATEGAWTIAGSAIRLPMGVAMAAPAALPAALPAKSARRVPLLITTSSGLSEGVLCVIVDVAPERPSETAMPASIAATSKLAAKAELAVAPQLSIVAAPAALIDGQWAEGMLQLVNGTPFKLTEVTLSALGTRDLDIWLPEAGVDCGATGDRTSAKPFVLPKLDSGELVVERFCVQAAAQVRPSKQHLSLLVKAMSGSRGTLAVTSSTSLAVEVSVFGLDLLAPIGVGALFLLPGLFAIALYLFLSRGVYPKQTAQATGVDFKSPANLLAAVVVGVPVYVVVWLWLGHDLTSRYGRFDVLLLTVVSSTVGFVVWVLMAVNHFRRDRLCFRENEEPIMVLRRLHWSGRLIQLPKLESKPNELVLGLTADDKTVVCSKISYTMVSADPEIERGFHAAIDENMLKTVVEIVKDGSVSLQWHGPTPRLLKPEDKVTSTRERLLIQQ